MRLDSRLGSHPAWERAAAAAFSGSAVVRPGARSARRFRMCSVALGAGLLLAAPRVQAQSVEFLQNDGYSSGAFTCNTGATGADDVVAAKFTAPLNKYPYSIDRVRVLTCGSFTGYVAVEFWQDNGDTAPPSGPSLWAPLTAFQIGGGAPAFYDIILTNEFPPAPMITSGTVRVGLVNLLAGGTGFGADTNGIQSHRNFVRSGTTFTWDFAESLGVSGDWILRLGIVSDVIFKDGFDPAP